MNGKKIAAAAMMTIALIGGAMVMNNPGDADLDNVKEWDAKNKIITIKDDKAIKLMTVRLLSSEPDLCTFTEVYEVSNFKAFIPAADKDFKARTVKHRGNKSVKAVEWFIEQNVSYTVNITDYTVVQVEKEVYNNKTGKNETILVNKTVISGYHDETRYKDVWQDYKPHGKPISKDRVHRIKVIYHKPPEIGDVRIQTIPTFRGVECDELTWWNASWASKREIKINNTGGSALSYYPVYGNLTDTPINATSLRVVNETADATVPHWQETISSGNCTELWFNTTSIPASAWYNGTYYIYCGNDAASSASNGDATFDFFDDFLGGSLDTTNKWTLNAGSISVSGGEATSSGLGYARSQTTFGLSTAVRVKYKVDGGEHGYSGYAGGTGRGGFGWSYPTINILLDGGQTIWAGSGADAAHYTRTNPAYTDMSIYNIYDIERESANAVNFYQNSANEYIVTVAASISSADLSVVIGGYSAGKTSVYDWVLVRKYAATEPAASFGDEESYVSISSYAPATPLSKYEGEPQTFNVTASESCQCRWYINGALVQTNSTLSTEHAYTNTSLALGANQNFSAVVNTSTRTDMQTWDVDVSAAGPFEQSVYKDSWQYVTNLNSTSRTFSQFFTQMSAYYLVHFNKTAQRTYNYKSGRWTKYTDYEIPSGDVVMLRYTANDTIARYIATPAFSGTLKTGLNQIGHSYNGTRNLTWYNTTIASSNVSTITYSYPINGTTKIYTYGSSANGTVGVAQGFGVEINVTADTVYSGI